MQKPVQVSFRDVPVSDAVQEACWREAERLERYYDRITSCRVVIAQPHRHHVKGNLYDIRVDLSVPGGEVVVDRTPPSEARDEDVYVAIRDAFKKARRQLEDHVRRLRHDVKTHEEETLGGVVKLFAFDGYGFLSTPEGQEIYFHRNAVAGDGFDDLELGDPVRYVAGEGEKGPQAVVVRPARRGSPNTP